MRSLLGGGAEWRAPAVALADSAAAEWGDRTPASLALFRDVVEPLADRFEPRLAQAYDAFFSLVLDRALAAPAFVSVRSLLERRGCSDERSFLARRERLGKPSPAPETVERVHLLSRVTVGADAAVGAALVATATARFPDAEIVFWGGQAAAALFAGHPRMRSEVVAYPRRGPLLARLEAWAALSERLQPGPRDLVIDPDTRWTQSGLLPLSDDDGGYRFFPSRAYAADSEQPLAALAADWFSETLGGAPAVPRLYLSEEVRDGGAAARAGLSTPVAVVNFGVGGNLTKRVADPFEAQAVRALLDAGYSVTLDSGFGPEEEERAQRIEAAVGDRRLRLWRGSVAALAGLISGADLYLGYDSAGAHLAAASGVRVIDVFAGAVSERMRSRWRPSGSGRVDVIPVGPHDPPAAPLSVLRGLLR